jgi:hypothetical protein
VADSPRERVAAPAWLFPAPVRPSRFRASGARWEQYNVEVALDLIKPFAFDSLDDPGECLLYACATGLDGNMRGQLGTGRGGIFRGRYLKGVGRTPAAANWNDPADRISASGRLSVSSALRERLVTIALSALGLEETVAGCEAVLFAELSPAQQQAVAAGRTGISHVSITPADRTMFALTVKPGDFARPGNVVFALDNFCRGPWALGERFLELEHYLHPPSERGNVSGAPREIVAALEAAFQRGLSHFDAWARIGLHWGYVGSNFALDGRFVDIEAPTFFGRPFIGVQALPGGRPRLLGFEDLLFVREWRLFIAWLRARIELLRTREVAWAPAAQRFLDELADRIGQAFSRQHLMHDDTQLVRHAVANLEGGLDLSARGRRDVTALAEFALRGYLYGADEPLPEVGWRVLEHPPTPAVPVPTRYETPGCIDAELTSEAECLAAGLSRLGAIEDIDTLVSTVSRFRLGSAPTDAMADTALAAG